MVQTTATLPRMQNQCINESAWLDSLSQTYSPDLAAKIKALLILLHDVAAESINEGLEIAGLLSQLHAGTQAIQAGLLWPAYRENAITSEWLSEQALSTLTPVLYAVANMQTLGDIWAKTADNTTAHYSEGERDKQRKLLLSMINDVRVVLVKLAERTIALRYIDDITLEDRPLLAQEAMDIYAPLANRLGIGQLKWELEDRALLLLEPETYKKISRQLAERRVDREHYLDGLHKHIDSVLKQAGVHAEISGRVKHITSIWRKMRQKNLSFERLFDLRAIRILVKDVATCYRVLSCLHDAFSPITAEFADYIASPKPNGYQSIHTVVQGPDNKSVEIQIRTFAMHEESEMGVAAHWRYKEGVDHDAGFESRISWLRTLLEWQRGLSEKVDAEQHWVDQRLYVFTPAGQVLELPAPATVLDFAYHVHTDVGHRCRGAKVNQRMVPLNFALATGDRVEILTQKQAHPSRDWLKPDAGYLLTSRARQKAARWFRHERQDEYADEGRERLWKELAKRKLPKPPEKWLCQQFQMRDIKDVYAGIAKGDIRLITLLTRWQQAVDQTEQMAVPAEEAEHFEVQLQRQQKNKLTSQSPFIIEGVPDVMARAAQCCQPVMGDAIVGLITTTRGISVHRQDCNNIALLDLRQQARVVEVSWAAHSTTQFVVGLRLITVADTQLVQNVINLFATEKLPLVRIETRLRKASGSQLIKVFTEVAQREQLDNLQEKLQQLAGIKTVSRV